MLEPQNLNSIMLAISLCLFASSAIAKGPKIDFNNKTVIITDAKSARHTGFLAKYQGKTVIICHEQAFGIGYNITDLNDKQIEFTDVILPSPKLKRRIILIQLPEDCNLPAFELEEKISETIKPGTKIGVKGMRKDKKKVSGGKGTVAEVKDDKINLKCKVIFELTGAPVVTNDTGKVIGVAISKKKKRFEIPYAMRIDNLGKTTSITKKEADAEISRSEELYNLLVGYSGIYMELNKIIQESGLTNPKINFKHINPDNAREIAKKIQDYRKQLEAILEKLEKRANEMKCEGNLKLDT